MIEEKAGLGWVKISKTKKVPLKLAPYREMHAIIRIRVLVTTRGSAGRTSRLPGQIKAVSSSRIT